MEREGRLQGLFPKRNLKNQEPNSKNQVDLFAGTEFLVLGIWFLGFGSWDLVLGIWFLGFGSWDLVLGIWFLGFGSWDLVLGIWFLGFGSWDLVLGIWLRTSMANQMSEFNAMADAHLRRDMEA